MEYLKKIIMILIIIIMIIVICLIGIISYQNKQENKIQQAGDIGEDRILNKEEMKDVVDRNNFYTVKSCVQHFLNEINDNNSSYFSIDENNMPKKIISDQEINQHRYNLLSKKFIDDNDIDLNNINNYLNVMNSEVIFDALKMKYMVGEQVENYVVYGIMTSLDNKYIGDVYFKVNLDRENKTFSVEPLNDNVKNIEELEITYDGSVIESNQDNSFNDIYMIYEKISKEYFSMYKRIVLSKPEIIYEYLQNEYRDKRFGDLETFKGYINKNKDEIIKLQLTKYSIKEKSEYTEIVIMDQYQNFYTINETNIMNLEIKLDSYTILSEKFKNQYDNYNGTKKVAMNIERWVQMLNSRDYENAYKMLDKTFRENKWNSVREFESYMRSKFSLHYDIEYTTYREENGTYIQNIILKDKDSDNEQEVSIIMQLKDDYNFVMSFSI